MNQLLNPNLPYALADIDKGLCVGVTPEFYSKPEADEIFNKLETDVVYNEGSTVVVFGKTYNIPRKQVAYGDPGLSYKFSGTEVPAKPWIPIISQIKADIEESTGLSYNFCLVNRYKDGSNHIGYHKDDEKDLDENSSIASVSFGATRKFCFQYDKKIAGKNLTHKIDLVHGTLCIMYNPTNKYWKHSIPSEASVKKPRINLTFRKINN